MANSPWLKAGKLLVNGSGAPVYDDHCCCGSHACVSCCTGGGAADTAILTWAGGVTSAGGCDTCDQLPGGTYDLGPEVDFSGGCFWGYESSGAACDGDCSSGGATSNFIDCNRSCAVGGSNTSAHCRGTFQAFLRDNGDGTCIMELDACIFVCEGNNSTGGETGYCAASAQYLSTPFANNASCPGTYTLSLQAGSYVNEGFSFAAFCAGSWPATCTLTI